MSDSMSAHRDDLREWNEFCEKTKIPLSWRVYSPDSMWARRFHNERGLVGRELMLAVKQELETIALKQKHATQQQELKQLIELEKKYQ
jgi:hypothetical protein